MSDLSDRFDALSGLSEDARAAALRQLAAQDPALAAALQMLFDAEGDAAAVPDPPDAAALLQCLPAGLDVGGFRLLSPLGAGGMGEVWLGERLHYGVTQRAAIKLLRADRRSTETGRRFLDEQRIVATLSHPNIVRLVAMGLLADGTPWLAMDLVEGQPLLQYCDQHRLTLRQRLQLMVDVLGAVQHAHQHLVVHRDLKSEHILIDADGEPHLLDFGIARRLDAGLPQTAPGGGFFSACNVSPEQLTGEPISVATDVYQLGLLLYRLVSGSEAQQRDGVALSVLQGIVLEQSPRPPSEMVDAEAAFLRRSDRTALRRALRGDLDRIILHALRAAPAERYPTATAFRDDLQAWMASRPVMAVGQGRGYRTRKFIQRHRVAVSVSSVALLLLGAASVTLLRNELALARAHREAVTARDAATLHAERAEQVRDLLLDLFREADPALDGTPGAAARIDDAAALLRDRNAVGDLPELSFALVEAAIGLGQHERAAALLEELASVPLSLLQQRQHLLLRARLAVAIQDRSELSAQLKAVAPLMAGASDVEQHQYLRLLTGVLLDSDPARVLHLTDIKPVPPILIRIRARAMLQLGEAGAAATLLRTALQRRDLGRLRRLGLQQALVTALINSNQTEAAVAVSQEMIDSARPLLGADNRAMLGYWNTRANALASVGKRAEALRILDMLLERPELAPSLRQSLELNRLLFGSAVPDPDSQTGELLERYWPERATAGLVAQRILLLARLRLQVHAGQIDAARRDLESAVDLQEGFSVEARLLRRWDSALRLSVDSAAAQSEQTDLTQLDPILARYVDASPRR